MLSQAELDSMQAIEESVQTTTGIIYRYGTAADGMGGFTESWGAVGTILCDVWPVNQRGDREKVIGGQITSRGDWFITCPFDTSVTAKDRVQVGTKTYEITFVPSGSQWLTALRLEAILYNEEQRV